MRFLLISDLHFGADEASLPPSRKHALPSLLARVAREGNAAAAFLAACGDLTDNGYDGTVTGKWLMPWLGTNTACTGGSENDQLGALRREFVDPVDASGLPLFMISGNHDTYNGAGRRPVVDFLKARHGARFVVSTPGTQVTSFFLGCYPDVSTRRWLRRELRSRRLAESRAPCVFFMHYNLSGPYSDWFPDDEKLQFAEVIADVHVACICVGHHHVSRESRWEGHRVIAAAGRSYADVDVTDDGHVVVRFDPPPRAKRATS